MRLPTIACLLPCLLADCRRSPNDAALPTTGDGTTVVLASRASAPGPADAAQCVVETVAGSDTWGHADGTGPAARFQAPQEIASAPDGVLLVTDLGWLRRVTRSGETTTVAGKGRADQVTGLSGPDMSPDAPIPDEAFLAIGGNGDVYISDVLGHRVRKLTRDGTVVTFAGSGRRGFKDGTGGPKGSTEFDTPSGIAIDAKGNIYVADARNNAIRKIAPDGNTTTLAGNGAEGIADGTGGSNGTARFHYPVDLAVDDEGNVFVADYLNHTIRKITPNGATSTLAGNGTPGYADGDRSRSRFDHPRSVALDGNGNLYVADNLRIRRITSAGETTTVAGTGTWKVADGAANLASFSSPQGLVVDPDGNVLLTDDRRIRRIRPVPR